MGSEGSISCRKQSTAGTLTRQRSCFHDRDEDDDCNAGEVTEKHGEIKR